MKTVLITGANRGIGFETAKQLASKGFHVVIGARDVTRAQLAVEAIRKEAGEASCLELDAANTASIQEAAAAFSHRGCPLEVLILTISREQLAATFQTNTFGPVIVTQAFLPYLRKAQEARVINVSSGYGQLDGLSANVPSYCLSKLTLNGVTIMLAEALKSDNIVVNSMCPGWVRTEMGGANAPRSVQEGANTAVWLATEAPHEFTGKFFRDRQEITW
jgi:NAD(P)-dependent dehydrogenase (short-subunit alcohol dehydrogenase family)